MKFGVLAAFISGCLACSDGPGSSGPGVSIDTIGSIIHVRNPAPVELDTLESIVRIGQVGGMADVSPQQFGRVTSVVLGPEGNVFVADAQAREVRVFSPRGEHRSSFGRSGAGPGEFRDLSALAWVSDTLLTLDSRNARISGFDSGGNYLTSWRWLPLSGPADFVRFYPVGAREVYVLGLRNPPVASTTFLRYSPQGLLDTLDIPPPEAPSENLLRCPVRGGTRFFSVPFAGRRLMAPAPEGEFVVAWSTIYRIVVLRPDGDTVRVIEREYAPIPVTEQMWHAATADYEEFREEWPGIRCEPAAMERPKYQPALQGLYADQSGRLVVEVTAATGVRYDFFDEQGTAVATVLVRQRDRGVAPYFRDGLIAQVAQDSLGVQFLDVFRRIR